jgi:hypothetical protein
MTKEMIAEVAQRPDAPVTLLDIISAAVSNPMVDVSKLERLLALRDKEVAAQLEKEFNAAMTRAQEQMRPISADAENPQTRSRYATYAKLDNALRPIYTSEGFSLSFDEGDTAKPGYMRVLCYVAHNRGHVRTYHKDLPLDGLGTGGKVVMTTMHTAGSASSYGARYLLKGIFNVAVGEVDDDGNCGDQELDVISQWIDAIKNATTVEELRGRGAELAKSALSGKARAKIRPVFDARMQKLKVAA